MMLATVQRDLQQKCPIPSKAERTTLEEERRDAFEGVLQFMQTTPPDSDRVAACAHLLRHLARAPERH